MSNTGKLPGTVIVTPAWIIPISFCCAVMSSNTIRHTLSHRTLQIDDKNTFFCNAPCEMRIL